MIPDREPFCEVTKITREEILKAISKALEEDNA